MKKYIGEKETMWLFVILQTSRFMLGAIHSLIAKSYGAAFLSIFVGGMLTLIAWILISKVFYTLKSKNFNTAVGTTAGTVISVSGILIFLITVLNTSWRIQMFVEAINIHILPSSPYAFVLIILAFAAFACAYFGAEPVTRYSIAVGAGMIILCVLVGMFNIKRFSTSNICPVIGNAKGTFFGGLQSILYFSDIFYLYIFYDYFKSGYSIKKIGIKSTAISVAFAFAMALIYGFSVGYPLCLEGEYPVFELARLAKTSVVFQRFDGIVYIIWLFSGFVSCGALCLISTEIFVITANVKDRRGIVPAVLFLIFVLAFSKIEVHTNAKYICLVLVTVLPAIIALSKRSMNNEDNL